MDPDACLKRVLRAFLSDDWGEFGDAYDDLAAWLFRGGFAPKAFEDAALRDAFEMGWRDLKKHLESLDLDDIRILSEKL